MKSGIYKITNLINSKFYIGSSKNCRCRKNQHFSDLKLNKHCNRYLQRSYNKYGKENFKFEILENCEIDQLLILEQKYIDELKPQYNLGSVVGGDTMSNNPNKAEICAKISKTLKERFASMTPEERSRKSYMSPEEIKQRYGGRTKEKSPTSKCGKSYFVCPICGIEKRKNSTQDRKNCKKCMPKRKVKIDNIIYDNVIIAAEKLNVHRNTIYHKIKSDKFTNYSYYQD